MAFNDAFAYGLLLTCNETLCKLEVLEGLDINGLYALVFVLLCCEMMFLRFRTSRVPTEPLWYHSCVCLFYGGGTRPGGGVLGVQTAPKYSKCPKKNVQMFQIPPSETKT